MEFIEQVNKHIEKGDLVDIIYLHFHKAEKVQGASLRIPDLLTENFLAEEGMSRYVLESS